jgi:hypothetical protein
MWFQDDTGGCRRGLYRRRVQPQYFLGETEENKENIRSTRKYVAHIVPDGLLKKSLSAHSIRSFIIILTNIEFRATGPLPWSVDITTLACYCPFVSGTQFVLSNTVRVKKARNLRRVVYGGKKRNVQTICWEPSEKRMQRMWENNIKIDIH